MMKIVEEPKLLTKEEQFVSNILDVNSLDKVCFFCKELGYADIVEFIRKFDLEFESTYNYSIDQLIDTSFPNRYQKFKQSKASPYAPIPTYKSIRSIVLDLFFPHKLFNHIMSERIKYWFNDSTKTLTQLIHKRNLINAYLNLLSANKLNYDVNIREIAEFELKNCESKYSFIEDSDERYISMSTAIKIYKLCNDHQFEKSNEEDFYYFLNLKKVFPKNFIKENEKMRVYEVLRRLSKEVEKDKKEYWTQLVCKRLGIDENSLSKSYLDQNDPFLQIITDCLNE